MRKGWAGLGAGLVLCVASHAWAGDQPEVGDEAGSFMLKAINPEVLGNSSPNIRLDDFVGPEAKTPKKAVVLSFFASWCEPCKREMPFLQVLFDAYAAQGLHILSITIDKEPDKVEIAHSLASKNNLKFPVLSDHYGILARRYSISKLPCVYLVNSAGKLAWINVGYGDDASKNMHDEVRKALGIPASTPAPAAVTQYLATPHTGAGHAESVEVPGAEAKADPNKTTPPANGPSGAAGPANGDAASADATDPPVKGKKAKGKKAKAKKAKKALADD